MKHLRRKNIVYIIILFLFSVMTISLEAPGKKEPKKLQVPSVRDIIEKTDAKLKDGQINVPYAIDNSSQGEDKTLSPCFYIPGAGKDDESLPLKETSAGVKIAGVVAGVEIRQVFGNDGKKPIEAVYVFPASTRAAVHRMTMKIGERTIVAKIDKREEAKEKYAKAKAGGKHASLLEQERPNVLTMQVANIMPGDTIEVLVEYSELLLHEESLYEFAYPAVVGPRYGGGADPASDEWIASPCQHQGEGELYKFDLKVDMETGVPLKEVASPSHKIDVKYGSGSRASVTLAEKGGGNRDFILKFRLAGEKIGSDVLLYEHGDENFFLLMVQPPKKPAASQVLPAEYIFLLDVSGSMSGFPLDTGKTLMRSLLKELRSGDWFDIVTFSGGAWTMSEGSIHATDDNVTKAMKNVGELYGSGGTELMAGLERAYAVPRPDDKKVSRTVVVVTDGYVGVEAKAFKFIREHLSDANLFAFGIGTSVNRYLIEGMARAGFGEPFIVTDQGKAAGEAEKFRKYVSSPLLTDISVDFKNFDVYDEAPPRIPDLMAERPLTMFGKYRGKAGGTIRVTGTAADGAFERTIKVDPAAVKKDNAPIRQLWVRKWVDLLEDQLCVLPGDKEIKKSITTLGLYYSLLTPFTSFVAIDEFKVNKTGKVKKVKQPLPMPAGVSDLAAGDSSPMTAKGALMGTAIGSSYGYGGMGLVGTGSGGGAGSAGKAAEVSSGTTVTGSLSKDSIKKIIKDAIIDDKGIKELYDTAVQSCGCGELRFKLSFKIKADGTIDDIKVKASDEDTKKCKCTEDIVKAIKKSLGTHKAGPGLVGGGEVSINFPLVLKP